MRKSGNAMQRLDSLDSKEAGFTQGEENIAKHAVRESGRWAQSAHVLPTFQGDFLLSFFSI